jgi:hypothetical protein
MTLKINEKPGCLVGYRTILAIGCKLFQIKLYQLHKRDGRIMLYTWVKGFKGTIKTLKHRKPIAF